MRLRHLSFAAEAERLLRSCQEQLDAAKREVVMFKRTANHVPPKQQPASQSHISQPLLNSYIGAAIRCVSCRADVPGLQFSSTYGCVFVSMVPPQLHLTRAQHRVRRAGAARANLRFRCLDCAEEAAGGAGAGTGQTPMMHGMCS